MFIYLQIKQINEMVYLITYDLKTPDGDYNSLYEEIKSIGANENNCHPLESTWLIESDLSVEEIYTRIKSKLNEKDLIFVVNITQQKRQGWMPKIAWEWLYKRE